MLMNLYALILFVSVMNISAMGYAQQKKLNLNLRNSTLKEVFQEIENQSEFTIFYKNSQVDDNQDVNIKLQDKKVDEVLDNVLSNTNLKYVVKDKVIIVLPKRSKVNKTISGTVTDSENLPLPGVSISVKGSDNGTVTDENGKFTLTLSESDQILVVSFVGMKTQEIIIGEQKVFEIKMNMDNTMLDELVVVGYGVQKKINLTGAVSSIKSEELLDVSAANTSELLIGKVPGLITKQVSGVPGNDSPSIQVRGLGAPLVLVDGLEMSLSRIDPNEIESISILKDASAAIYGVQAGNGVILVTTKRGSKGKPQISYHGNVSFQAPTRYQNRVNASEFVELWREALVNDGQNPDDAYTVEELEKYKSGELKSHDWTNGIMRDWTPMYTHNLSMRGGSERVKFFTSIGYVDQQSVFKSDDLSFKRYNVRSNIDAKIIDGLNLSFDLFYKKEERDSPGASLNEVWNDLSVAKPTYPYELPDKSKAASCGFLQRSPLARTQSDMSGFKNDEREQFAGKLELMYALPFVKGLKIKASAQYRSNNTYIKQFKKAFDVYAYNQEADEYSYRGTNNPKNELTEQTSRSYRIVPRLTMEYNKTYGNHDISGLLLYESVDNWGDNFWASREGILAPSTPYLFAGSEINIDNSGGASESGTASYAGRLNYAFKSKYLLEGTFRYDANSKYPENSRWGFFPSISGAWRISEESFIKDKIDFINNLKLRLSYSQTGRAGGGGAFDYLTGYIIATGDNAFYQIGDELNRLIYESRMPNVDITWEKMTNFNVGVDFTLLKGLIGGEVDVFYRRVDDILEEPISRLPSTIGIGLPNQNISSSENKGFEVLLTHKNKIGEFTYNVSGSFSVTKDYWINKEQRGLEKSNPIYDILILAGNDKNRQIGYVSDGLFQTQEQIDNHPVDQDQSGNVTLEPGDIIYKDLDGDGTITSYDRKVIGYGGTPDISYSLRIGGKYKGFSLSMLWQGASMFDVTVSGSGRSAFSNESIPLDYHYENRWQPVRDADGNETGGSGSLPRVSFGGTNVNNNKFSDFWLKDGTYLRLKSLNFGYTLPKKWIKPYRITNTEFYISGSNLLTFSNLGIFGDSYDPEGPSTKTLKHYPVLKTFTVGVKVTL